MAAGFPNLAGLDMQHMEHVEPCLRAILYSIQNHLYGQAVFFADRILAASSSASGPNASVTLELWADALLRAGEYEQVRWQLRGKRLSVRLHYLHAVACIKLEQYQEAEVALLGGDLEMVELWKNHTNLDVLGHVVEGAAGLYQLGLAAEGMRRREQAYECYAKCLKVCPFMWCAFERLSSLSLCQKRPESCSHEFAKNVFDHDALMRNQILFPQGEVCKTVPEKCGFKTPRKRRRSGSMHSVHSAQSAKSLSPFGQRSLGSFSPRLPLLDKDPVTPAVRPTWSPNSNRALSMLSPKSLQSPKSPSAKKCSTRFNVIEGTAEGTCDLHPGAGTGICVGKRSFTTVLQGLGEALHSLHRFRCQDAIQAVKTLGTNEQHSAFCENLIARCFFEMQNYEEASENYSRCCKQHRFFRSLGLEYYSTALWQLGDRLELGNLSRQVLEWGRNRPRAWCVLGNCFSLNNETEEAIKCFRRAIQLDPNLVYAYSLIGHELVALEKYDKAIQMFQAALDLDPRQYNAWWGLGDVFQRQEDFSQAKYNFLRALDINPSNQVLKTSLSAVLQALGDSNEALQLLSSAGSGSGRALALFQKGRLLCLQARHAEAVEELRKACYLAPKEAGIHFHLGSACQSLGDHVAALKHFTSALDLASSNRDRHLVEASHRELRQLRGDMDI